jgi:hypothetical protein
MKEVDQSSLLLLIKHPENEHVAPGLGSNPEPPTMTRTGSGYYTKELPSQILI